MAVLLVACEQSAPPPAPLADVRLRCEAPPLALGLDAYRRFDKLSYLELGPRVVGETTADPGGTNADNSHPVRVDPRAGPLLLDQAGPGIVTFLRMQEAIGAPWRLTVDGAPPVTVTPEDLGQMTGPFPYPLSLNAEQTPGSSILATPIPFARSIRWSASAPNGNFYALVRRLPFGTAVPRSASAPTEDVASLLSRPAPTPQLDDDRGVLALAPGRETTVATVTGGPRQLRSLRFRVPVAQQALGDAILRVYWDGEAVPSVDVPLKFAAGVGAGVYQPVGRPLVTAWPVQAGGGGRTTEFTLSWPMPFRERARVTLGSAVRVEGVEWTVGHEPFPDPPAWWGTFHATYTDVARPTPGEDLVFADIGGSGRLVGTVVNFSEIGQTLEGDPNLYIDDAQTPQVRVTGTEEWGTGGNYWRNGVQTTLALGGLPSATNNPPPAAVDGAALYRFLVADSVPFNRRLVVRWQHGPGNDSSLRYRAAVFWYGTPTPTALPTDEVAAGDPAGLAAHQDSSDTIGTYRLTAAHGYAVHGLVTTDTVRASDGEISFTLAVDPRNAGAFLRRTLDDAVPDQRAEVFVDGQFAGTWYTPGSFAGASADGVARRWRDDEFPLPPQLTAGKSSIRVALRHVPTVEPRNGPWTASRYRLYSLVPPGCW